MRIVAQKCMHILLLILVCNNVVGCSGKTPPRVHMVEIKQMKFQPTELIAGKGDTVVWINRDIMAHDVTEEKNKAWSSSVLPAGKSWKMVVTQSSDYYCSLHQVMKGKIIIK